MSSPASSAAQADMQCFRLSQLQHGLDHGLFTPQQQQQARKMLDLGLKDPPPTRDPDVRTDGDRAVCTICV